MSGASEPTQLTFLAATRIRGLIMDGVLLPGEKLRQLELAERIGVSRSPLREALRTLESEGILSYEVNRGYVVARLEPRDVGEIFHMRALLEGELLRSVPRPGQDVLDALARHNDAMMTAIDHDDIAKIMRGNRDFHFTIFELSPMRQFKREVARLWQLAEGYRGWWWLIPDAPARIDREHRQIISALRRFDLDRLVEVSDAHRVGGHQGIAIGAAAALNGSRRRPGISGR